MFPLLLLLNFIATVFMTGVIWFVQVIHYPLFAKVGEAGYVSYQNTHMQLTTFVVAPMMVAELATAVLLLLTNHGKIPPVWLWVGLIMLLLLWGSTFLIQVPLHTKLVNGFNAELHQKLVATNWLRTILWTARTVLIGWLIYTMLSK